MSNTTTAILSSWTVSAPVIVMLLVASIWYAAGLWKRRKARGVQAIIPMWRVASYYAGLVVVGLALLSPIDVFSGIFFFFHMIQHLLLQLIAPPLVLLGRSILPILWALPARRRKVFSGMFHSGSLALQVGSRITHPLVALSSFTLVIWFWHAPSFYDATLRSNIIHNVEHVTFVVTGFLFWWPVIHPTGGRRRMSLILAIPYLFAAGVLMTPVAAILTLAGSPIYAHYAELPALWGISTLVDQQLGGLIMWVGGGTILLVCMGIAFYAFADADKF